MLTRESEQGIQTLNVFREVRIAAPIAVAFDALLEELGPEGRMPTEDGGSRPFPMRIEPWPGGRWYRDLGDGVGHLWGHVQVIKPPSLLEICGPLFMSYPAVSHVQYRLAERDGGVDLSVRHRAMGEIPADDREGVGQGWEYGLQRVREIAEGKVGK